ncbi:putative cardiolipin synthase YwiE [Novipirellula galeiformis]|uniref:Cardiolipin synthase n=1 Tax=Novipirellula galeiformis TaxID=2528004 RepID=A0A5C6CG94_9BACT|nr:cardiolipin synthase [Novipirellula galeiformis]TWU22266.1 putative cardiolipin synthase YwiE [Novipirellula galeiformis]
MSIFDSLTDQWWFITVIPAIVILIELLAIASAFHSLRHVRTSQAAVAWVIGLITIPFLVLPMYWVFARHRFEGYREAIRAVGERYVQSVELVRRELVTEVNARSTSASTTSANTTLEYLADVLDTPLCTGNTFRLLIDGEAFFDTLLSQIEAAQEYLYLAFYIIRDDELGNRVAEALVASAARGVVVRLLYDEVGCLRLSQAYLDRLAEGGVDVRAFNTRQGFVNRFQINFRNHRKLVIVDGKVAIVGGLNLGDEYLGKASWVTRWRDTAVEIHGELARKVQAVFAGDYYWAARIDLPEARWDRDPNPQNDSGLAAVCATGPADPRPRATMMFAAVAGAARERLWISTPYLVPDDALMVALSMARARGVDVRLLIPSVADQWAVYMAGYHYEQELAELGIPVYRYQGGVLHQKCVLVDDELVLIGSTNFDNRSLHLNFELMVAIAEPSLITEVANMLEQDFAESQWSNALDGPLRPWLARVGTAIARLFSPVL